MASWAATRSASCTRRMCPRTRDAASKLLIRLAVDPIRTDVERRLAEELGLRVIGWSALAGGTQNRVFRLEMERGPALVAKLYHRDRWNRLEREFGALSLLGQLQVRRMPRAILKSDAESYAVYSFEPGSSKPASELDERELVEIATFAAALERVTPERGELETAVGASFCVADHFKEIDARLRAF